MSNVPSWLKNISKMEFYKNAIDLKTVLLNWLLNDMGANNRFSIIKNACSKFSEEDKAAITELITKYEVPEKLSKFPSWFTEHAQNRIFNKCEDIVDDIVRANSFHPLIDKEWERRRVLQGDAISICKSLYQDLQTIPRHFSVNLNWYTDVLDCIDHEIALIEAWRTGDNAIRNKKGLPVKDYDLKKGGQLKAANFCNSNRNGNANYNDASNTNIRVRPR